MMKLPEILQDKKKQILSIWIERTLDSYTSSGFFKKSRDQFANPIGANIRDGLTRIFDLLVQGADINDFTAPMDQVIRIRAIQEFTPSQAIAPFLEIKWVIRQILADDKKIQPDPSELDNFECETDRLALAAFDMYTRCREQLYQVRIKELKSGRSILSDTPCSSKMMVQDKESLTKIN